MTGPPLRQRLLAVLGHVTIGAHDCDDLVGIAGRGDMRIEGRVLACDAVAADGRVFGRRGEVADRALVAALDEGRLDSVRVRSVLMCARDEREVCAMCCRHPVVPATVLRGEGMTLGTWAALDLANVADAAAAALDPLLEASRPEAGGPSDLDAMLQTAGPDVASRWLVGALRAALEPVPSSAPLDFALELVVRSMLGAVRVVDAGGSSLARGEIVFRSTFERAVQRCLDRPPPHPIAEPVVLGLSALAALQGPRAPRPDAA